MNITLVYNPKSGTSLPLSELTQKCQAHGITITQAVDITAGFPANLEPHTTPGAHIAAIGGDGTLRAVVQAIYQRDVIFIPLPGGTLNHFTKDTGIPQDLDQALAALPTASPRQIDIARVNDKVFLNNSSIGIYPTSLRTREQIEDHLGKWPAAVVGVLRALVKFKLYTVTIEGETFQTPFIFVGNNDYQIGNGGQRTSLTSGRLCAYAIRSSRRSALVRLFVYALLGRLRSADEFVVHNDKTLTIATRRPKVTVSFDGEVERLTAPLHYESLPGKLTILG